MLKKIHFMCAVALCLMLCTVFASQAVAQDKQKININKASAEKLEQLHGVGDVLAERIVEYRKEHKFDTEKEITEVDGIGTKKYEDIKDNIIVASKN